MISTHEQLQQALDSLNRSYLKQVKELLVSTSPQVRLAEEDDESQVASRLNEITEYLLFFVPGESKIQRRSGRNRDGIEWTIVSKNPRWAPSYPTFDEAVCCFETALRGGHVDEEALRRALTTKVAEIGGSPAQLLREKNPDISNRARAAVHALTAALSVYPDCQATEGYRALATAKDALKNDIQEAVQRYLGVLSYYATQLNLSLTETNKGPQR